MIKLTQISSIKWLEIFILKILISSSRPFSKLTLFWVLEVIILFQSLITYSNTKSKTREGYLNECYLERTNNQINGSWYATFYEEVYCEKNGWIRVIKYSYFFIVEGIAVPWIQVKRLCSDLSLQLLLKLEVSKNHKTNLN